MASGKIPDCGVVTVGFMGVEGVVLKENISASLKHLDTLTFDKSIEKDGVETGGIRKLLPWQDIRRLGLKDLLQMYDVFEKGLDKRRAEKADALIASIIATKQVDYVELSIRCKDFLEHKGKNGSSNDKIMFYLESLNNYLLNTPKERPSSSSAQGNAVLRQRTPEPLPPNGDAETYNVAEEMREIVAAKRGNDVDLTDDVFVYDCKLSAKRLAEVGVVGQSVPITTTDSAFNHKLFGKLVYTEEEAAKIIQHSVETVIDAPVEVPNYSTYVWKRHKDNAEEVRTQLRRQAEINEFLNKNRPYVKTQTEMISDYFISDLNILREAIGYASELFVYAENIKTCLVDNSDADGGEPKLVNKFSYCAYGSLDEIIDLLDKLTVQQLHVDEHVASSPNRLKVVMTYYCQLKKTFRYFVHMVIKVIKPLTLQVYFAHHDSIWKWCDGLADKLNRLMMSNFCHTRELAVDPVYGFFNIGMAWIPLDRPIQRIHGNNLKSKDRFCYILPCMCFYEKGGTYDTHKIRV